MSAEDPTRARLAALVVGSDPVLDIAEAALLLAALDRPGVDLAPYRDHVAVLARRVGPEPGAVDERLFVRHRYGGDTETYDDPRNANLTHVIDRRRGLPVALGVLYIHVARAAGLAAHGLNVPGHFLVAIGSADVMAVRDPFNGGRAVDAAELRRLVAAVLGPGAEADPAMLAPMNDRGVLMRLENNIKVRAVRDGDFPRAAAVLEAMVVLGPGEPALWRELGEVLGRCDRLLAAASALERSLALARNAEEARDTELVLRSLRGRLN